MPSSLFFRHFYAGKIPCRNAITQNKFSLLFFTPLPCSPSLLRVLSAAEAFPTPFSLLMLHFIKGGITKHPQEQPPGNVLCMLSLELQVLFSFWLEAFFPLQTTCPMDQTGLGTIQSFQFFRDTKGNTKERREMGQRKEKTHRETRITKFNRVKGPEEARRSDLFTQSQDLHPFSHGSGPQVGHE